MATSIVTRMARLVFWTLRLLFLSREGLALENLALRQQVSTLKSRKPRPPPVRGKAVWSRWSVRPGWEKAVFSSSSAACWKRVP